MLNIFDEWFEYVDGEVLWKKVGHGIPLDRRARPSVAKNGYLHLWCRGKRFAMHRVVYYLVHGYLPDYIDHIDGDRANNNIDNLREATNQQNMRNATKRASCASQYKGVSRKRNKWRAYIAVNTKQITLGVFELEEDAARAYDEKAKELFGEFAKLNFPVSKV